MPTALLLILVSLALSSPSSLSGLVAVISNSNGMPSPISSTPAWPGGPQVYTSDSLGVSLTSLIPQPPPPSPPSRQLGAYCVLDGRGVINGTCSSSGCNCSLGPAQGAGAGLHSAALYFFYPLDSVISLVGDPVFFRLALDSHSPTHASASTALRSLTPPGSGRLGTYTTPYLTVPAQIYQNITRLYNRTVSLEDVVRGGGFLNSSVWAYQGVAASPPWNASTPSQVYQDTPALGMYCLWRARANESAANGSSSGVLPDCPEADTVLRTHASLMAAVGIEWVAPDATNSDGDPRGELGRRGPDLSILRPLEIMGEVWEGMRVVGGEATPQLSVFAKVAGGPLWRWLLDALYNNNTLLAADLVLMSSSSGSSSTKEKVFFAAAEPGWNASVVSLIEDNGGRGDVVAPLMWLSPNATAGWEESGLLTYVSPCVITGVVTATNGSTTTTTPRYSTEEPFVAPGTLTTPCGHRPTLHPAGLGGGGAFGP